MYTTLDEVYSDQIGVSVRNILFQIKNWMATKLSHNVDYVMCSYLLFLIRSIAWVSDTITLCKLLNMNINFNKPIISFPNLNLGIDWNQISLLYFLFTRYFTFPRKNSGVLYAFSYNRGDQPNPKLFLNQEMDFNETLYDSSWNNVTIITATLPKPVNLFHSKFHRVFFDIISLWTTYFGFVFERIVYLGFRYKGIDLDQICYGNIMSPLSDTPSTTVSPFK